MATRLESLTDGSTQTSENTTMVEVVTDPARLRDDWVALAGRASISPYQTYSFSWSWADTIGRIEDVQPFLVVARDETGRAAAILPLCVQQRAGLKIALFLGGRESNFNLPILDPNAHFDEASLRNLLRRAAKVSDDPPDLIYLRNQPRRFEGVYNPLAFAEARPSASFAYGATLPARVEDLGARLSKDARKKLKKKEARLAELGELTYEHCATGARGDAILEALIRQKSARFSDMGVDDAFGRGVVTFLKRLQNETGDRALELHALSVGGRIVATYAGIMRGGRFSGMLNSFDMDEEIARSSPGDLLLHALMRNLVSRGMTHFDLGTGEARYKNAVCDETIELCDFVLPVSARGAVAAPLFSAFLQLKRRVKQSPGLSRAYYRARRLIGRAK
ncbi:GNAT family N-acetyltransferase [Methylocystis parvus]|uniref:GNAT family N-acetyltransferase n=1 Tax=Methylocystis parvus TaxID=134 RepID=UPI003C7204E7